MRVTEGTRANQSKSDWSGSSQPFLTASCRMSGNHRRLGQCGATRMTSVPTCLNLLKNSGRILRGRNGALGAKDVAEHPFPLCPLCGIKTEIGEAECFVWWQKDPSLEVPIWIPGFGRSPDGVATLSHSVSAGSTSRL